MSHGRYIFSRANVREVDRRAIEDHGIPGIVLMENAARGAALLAMGMLEAVETPRVLLIAGGGNNGGDAFAVARHLHNLEVDVAVVALKPAEEYTGDALTNLKIIDTMDLPLTYADRSRITTALDAAAKPGVDLIVDGVFGTGLGSDVRAPYDAAIRWMNDAASAKLALDIPSGLDCDSGAELGVAVRADLTATFVGMKKGFLTHAGKTVIGRVAVVDIGVPRELVAELGEPM